MSTAVLLNLPWVNSTVYTHTAKVCRVYIDAAQTSPIIPTRTWLINMEQLLKCFLEIEHGGDPEAYGITCTDAELPPNHYLRPLVDAMIAALPRLMRVANSQEIFAVRDELRTMADQCDQGSTPYLLYEDMAIYLNELFDDDEDQIAFVDPQLEDLI